MGISRKNWLVLCAAALVAVMLAVPAFATAGGGGYMQWDSMGGANGTSPHGGYQTTTQKCVVCHAVHNAAAVGEALLQTPIADACTYCHIDGGTGYTQVYNGDANNWTSDNVYGHNSNVVGFPLTCTKCHQVHAAANQMTANSTYLTPKLLIGSKTIDDNGDGVYEYNPDAGAPLAGDSKPVAMTKWCTSCHDQSLSTFNTYYNGPTYGTASPTGHIMTTASANYVNDGGISIGKVAWVDSNYCSSCHSSGYGTSAWPHFTTGVRFLVSAGSAASATPVAATDAQQDGICLRCHVNGTGSGVGMNF